MLFVPVTSAVKANDPKSVMLLRKKPQRRFRGRLAKGTRWQFIPCRSSCRVAAFARNRAVNERLFIPASRFIPSWNRFQVFEHDPWSSFSTVRRVAAAYPEPNLKWGAFDLLRSTHHLCVRQQS